MFLVVPGSSSDLTSQTDDTNPSQTNTYLYTRPSQVSKTGIMVSNDHTVSQFPVMKSSSSKIIFNLFTMILFFFICSNSNFNDSCYDIPKFYNNTWCNWRNYNYTTGINCCFVHCCYFYWYKSII